MANSGNRELSRNQLRAIAALLANRNVADAAAATGIGARTIYRWLKEPVFQQALHEAETAAIADAVRALIADLSANHAVMREIRDSKSDNVTPRVRLSAAQALDNSLLHWRELLNVEERLERLERLYYENKD